MRDASVLSERTLLDLRASRDTTNALARENRELRRRVAELEAEVAALAATPAPLKEAA